MQEADIKYYVQDMAWTKRIMAVLLSKYPGYGWGVEVQHEQGIFKVWNSLITEHFGYLKKIAEVPGGTGLERVTMMIGGELLERAGLTRSRIDEAQVMTKRRLISGGIAGVDKK